MSNRFHNKFHRQNHHSIPTAGFPDSSFDPIASFNSPWRGEFFSTDSIYTTQNLSAQNTVFAFGGNSNEWNSVYNTVLTLSATWEDFPDFLNHLTTNRFVSASTPLVANYIPLATGINSIDDSVIYQNATNIGIGTTSPITKLHVASNDALILPVGNDSQRPLSTTPNLTGAIRYNTQGQTFEGFNGTSWGSLGGVIDTDKDTYISAENSPGADNDQLKFFTFGSQRMLIDSNGRVGIGTSSPTTSLHVSGEITAQNLYGHTIYIGGDSGGSDFEIGTNDPTAFNRITFYNRASAQRMDILAGSIYSSNNIYFDGPGGTNTDSLWIGRFNQGSDQTQLRINVGDNDTTGQASSDTLNIGCVPSTGGGWQNWAVVNSRGIVLNDTVEFTGETLTAAATATITASNDFLRVFVNGTTRYIRLFDIT